ncbi:MAG: MarR family winged helix-turn-helix transcriptional regulator, partial [Streptomyces sp.]|uniref:MarR family winged helix-turn-helix transcriptional regulator n=1 Tax=Streptomyces sp. TaxID=1931 RepID=UPI003D6A5E32
MDTEPRWLTEDEQRAWRTHLDVNRLLIHQLERDLQPFGLTMNDYEILVNLSESAEHRMRMSDLAAATLQSKSRLSHQITRMENAGLVRRESCESDKRGLFAVLTDEGWETMRTVAPHHVSSVRRHLIDRMPPED